MPQITRRRILSGGSALSAFGFAAGFAAAAGVAGGAAAFGGVGGAAVVPSTGSAIMARINLSIKSINLLRSTSQDQHSYIFCQCLCVKTKSGLQNAMSHTTKSLAQPRESF